MTRSARKNNVYYACDGLLGLVLTKRFDRRLFLRAAFGVPTGVLSVTRLSFESVFEFGLSDRGIIGGSDLVIGVSEFLRRGWGSGNFRSLEIVERSAVVALKKLVG